MEHAYSNDFFSHLPLYIAEVDQEALGHHSHEFFEMVYVRRGNGAHYIEDTAYPIKAGDLYVISPGERHMYLPVGDSKLRIVNVLWMPAFVEDVLRASSTSDSFQGARKLIYVQPMVEQQTPFEHRLHLSGRTAYRVESLIDEMRREINAFAPDSEVLLRHLFCALLVILSRAYNEQKGQAPKIRKTGISPQQNAVARAVQYIEEHHNEAVRVDEIAAYATMSPGRLAHVFKEHTGYGLIEYMHEFRISRACKALLQENASITEIAAEVGYNDLRFFHRLFRRRTGSNPTQYREAFKNSPLH